MIKDYLERVQGADKLLSGVFGYDTRTAEYAAAFKIPTGYNDPILLNSTDGVGTKKYVVNASVSGYDAVAMNVNDILAAGGDPLYFMDYYTTPELDKDHFKAVIEGVESACLDSGIELIGGEYAEMDSQDSWDIAGFAVGIAEFYDLNPPVNKGDVVIGVESSGPHANGWSIIRKAFGSKTPTQFQKRTKIYKEAVHMIRGGVGRVPMAHVTGGGLTRALDRLGRGRKYIMPIIEFPEPMKDLFFEMNHHNRSTYNEFIGTFNAGFGLLAAVSADSDVVGLISKLNKAGHKARKLGTFV